MVQGEQMKINLIYFGEVYDFKKISYFKKYLLFTKSIFDKFYYDIINCYYF